MPNDAISREAAIEAVEKLIRSYESTLDKLTAKESSHQSHTDFVEGASNGALAAKDAIASLPADTRWEELRKDVADAAKLYATLCNEQGDYSADAFRMVLIFMDRLAPAPAEAQD